MFSYVFTVCTTLAVGASAGNVGALGDFEGGCDVGRVGHAGAVRFDSDAREYHITGSGANVWGAEDAFHFVWRTFRGDVTLTADVRWPGQGNHPHRKTGWMIRQGLEPNAPYVDAVIHGDGLICLQYRKTTGSTTEEIQSPTSAPATIRFERNGDLFSLSISRDGKPFEPIGSLSVVLKDPLYAGLVVCSHDNSTSETAVLSNVEFAGIGQIKAEDRIIESTLEIIDVETSERRIVYRASDHFEAPNWSPDGSYLLFNSKGRLYKISLGGGEPKMLDTGFADKCNNDHGFSPDGKWLAISHSQQGQSLIYIIPSGGGVPRQVTQSGPSYWHAWSPDGRTLAYCAARDGKYDVYTIPVAGGDEQRLTDANGLDDGPDYSPDGQYIYFNSERTGLMKIWRMRTVGREQRQITFDMDYADWFAHPSPDGKQLVFLSYDKSVQGHPANKDVALRLMSLPDGKPRVLTRLYGGQGTINVPSWSPDSKQVAFVSYRLVGR